MTKSWIMQCPYCGELKIMQQLADWPKVFKCNKCGKSRTIKQKNIYGLSIKAWGPYEGRIASHTLIELKKQTNQDKETSDFHSYTTK